MKKCKKLFVSILIICLSFILLNGFSINIQASDYITYDLDDPPPVMGNLLSSHKVASETQFWRHSGGEWSYTPILGEGTKRISNDKMNQILQAQTSNEDFVISANLPGAVVNYLNSGKDNLKVKIRETNNNRYVYSGAKDRFQYRIDIASRKIYLKFQPQFNVERGKDFWAGSIHEGVVPSLPVVQEGYGNAMFAVYTRNPRASIGELEYGLDDPRKLQNPNEIRLSGSDGLLKDDKTYIFSNGVEFQGRDYQIGDGAFKSGGAMV